MCLANTRQIFIAIEIQQLAANGRRAAPTTVL